jgi:hypothetical protein
MKAPHVCAGVIDRRTIGAPIIVFVVNSGCYNTIRVHQARRFPGRPFATTIE